MDIEEFIQWHTILFFFFRVKCQKVTYQLLEKKTHSNLYVPLLGLPGNYSICSNHTIHYKSMLYTDTHSIHNVIFSLPNPLFSVHYRTHGYSLISKLNKYNVAWQMGQMLWSLASLEFLILSHLYDEQHPITSRDLQFCICAERASGGTKSLGEGLFNLKAVLSSS